MTKEQIEIIIHRLRDTVLDIGNAYTINELMAYVDGADHMIDTVNGILYEMMQEESQ